MVVPSREAARCRANGRRRRAHRMHAGADYSYGFAPTPVHRPGTMSGGRAGTQGRHGNKPSPAPVGASARRARARPCRNVQLSAGRGQRIEPHTAIPNASGGRCGLRAPCPDHAGVTTGMWRGEPQCPPWKHLDLTGGALAASGREHLQDLLRPETLLRLTLARRGVDPIVIKKTLRSRHISITADFCANVRLCLHSVTIDRMSGVLGDDLEPWPEKPIMIAVAGKRASASSGGICRLGKVTIFKYGVIKPGLFEVFGHPGSSL